MSRGNWLCFRLASLAILAIVGLIATTKVGAEEQEPCPEICTMAPEGGPCLSRKRFRMWYYHYDAKECRKFSYGGCKGNKNRFWTLEDCQGKCGKCANANTVPIDTQEDFCQLAPVQGKCESVHILPAIKWHFNVEEDKCEPFAYTGCGGNLNRFDTQDECEQICNGLRLEEADDFQ